MGAIYELLSTPVVYARKAVAKRRAPQHRETRIPYGPDSNQACVLYEPDAPSRRSVIMYFHGGGYLVGTPQSMGLAADAFTAQGYRFVSVGFSLMPKHPFPAQVEDAFAGVSAAVAYLRRCGVSCDSVVLCGASAGGHAAAMVAYGRALQASHGFDGSIVKGFISLAGVMDVDDMLARALPLAGGTERFVDAPGVDRGNRASVHEALVPYSPLQIVDERSQVPALILHGAHDKMSPYASQVRFVEKLNALTGTRTATLHAFPQWRYQHIVLTAGLFSENPAKSEGIRAIFTWLDAQGLGGPL